VFGVLTCDTMEQATAATATPPLPCRWPTSCTPSRLEHAVVPLEQRKLVICAVHSA
jgi:hypothetical protein